MKIDWIIILTIAMMIIAFVVGTYSVYKDKVNECTSNPLVYASKTLTEAYGYDFIGEGWFIVPFDKKGPRIMFNSYNTTYYYP